MADKIYNTISKYCEENNLNRLYESFLLHKYYEDYNTLINDYETKENKSPAAGIRRGFQETLMSEMTLNSNVKLAEDEIKNFTAREVRKVTRVQSLKEFALSTLSSVVGSILFAVLLIILFSVAQSQIKSWVEDIYDTNDDIENTINDKKTQESDTTSNKH